MSLDDGSMIERVQSYCYLGDVISEESGISLAITARLNKAWNKFRELSPLLLNKKVSLRLKGKLYASCVRSCMTYASETWAMIDNDALRFVRAERKMVRWMCGVSLLDKKSSDVLLRSLGLESVDKEIRKGRLRWYGHVVRKEEWEWVRKCMSFEVEGNRLRARPEKVWMDNVKKDMRSFRLVTKDAQEHKEFWRGRISGRD